MRAFDEIEVRQVLASTAKKRSEVQGQDLLIRPWVKGDVAWVTNSWLKNQQNGGQASRRVHGRIFADGWQRMMQHILPRAGVLVACDPEAPDVNFGWICAEVMDIGEGPTLTIHYAYVKDRFAAKRTKARRLPAKADGTRPERSDYAGGHGIGRLLLQTVAEPEQDCAHVRYTCHTPRGHGWLVRMQEEGVIPHPPEFDPWLLFSSLPRNWYA